MATALRMCLLCLVSVNALKIVKDLEDAEHSYKGSKYDSLRWHDIKTVQEEEKREILSQRTEAFAPRQCHAISGGWGSDSWCNSNCNWSPPYCPSSVCSCDVACFDFSDEASISDGTSTSCTSCTGSLQTECTSIHACADGYHTYDTALGTCSDIDGCTLHNGGCNGDAQATCSLGDGVNLRTCTCGTGYSGTVATLTDAQSFDGCTGIASGLLYHLKFDNTIEDSMGAVTVTKSSQCSSNNYVTGALSTSGRGYKFIRGSGCYISISEPSPSVTASSWTHAWWFKPDSTATTTGRVDFAYGNDGRFRFSSPTSPHFTYNRKGRKTLCAYHPNLCTTTSSFAIGTWYHVAWVRDGSTARVYLNGVLESAKTTTITPSAISGTYKFGDWLTTGGYTVDDMAIWTRALDLSEIKAIHTIGVSSDVSSGDSSGSGSQKEEKKEIAGTTRVEISSPDTKESLLNGGTEVKLGMISSFQEQIATVSTSISERDVKVEKVTLGPIVICGSQQECSSSKKSQQSSKRTRLQSDEDVLEIDYVIEVSSQNAGDTSTLQATADTIKESVETALKKTSGNGGVTLKIGDVTVSGVTQVGEMTVQTVFSGGSAKGDPHVTNVKGESFDIMTVGTHSLMEYPRNSSAITPLKFSVQANIERSGIVRCGPTYILALHMTGSWLGAIKKVEVRSGTINVAGSHKFYGVRMTPEEGLAGDWESGLQFANKGAITFAPGNHMEGVDDRSMKMTMGPLLVTVNQPRRPRTYLNIDVKNIGKLSGEVGGLLGLDNHNAAEVEPAECTTRQERGHSLSNSMRKLAYDKMKFHEVDDGTNSEESRSTMTGSF